MSRQCVAWNSHVKAKWSPDNVKRRPLSSRLRGGGQFYLGKRIGKIQLEGMGTSGFLPQEGAPPETVCPLKFGPKTIEKFA